MRRVGRESWRFAHDIDDGLHFALYLRDALALEVHGGRDDPPPLAGSVPDWSSQLASEAAHAAAVRWTAWWEKLVAVWAPAQLGPTHFRVDQSRWLGELAARHAQVMDPPDWTTLADVPPLQKAARACWAESRRWFALAREPHLPPHGQDVLAWERVRVAAERAAVEHQVSPGAVNGCAHVLLVEGSWWRVVLPGVALCSIAAARDPAASAPMLEAVFDSYLAR